MNIETTNQAYLFIVFMLNGILIGIIFDAFRILRRSFDTPNFITYIEDTLFWIITTLIILYSLFIFNNGQFRAYIFIGIFIGIAIYMLFFSKIIIKISLKIIEFVKMFFSYIYKIISYPIKTIYKFINLYLLKPIKNIISKIIIKLDKIKKDNKRTGNFKNKEGF